ncbi:MAG: hypothetical protein ABWY25_10270 [Paenisporosarcina sp.]
MHDISPPAAPKLLEIPPPPAPTSDTMPGRSIEWLQDAPSIDAVWWYVYRAYLDKDTAGKQLNPITCKDTYEPFPCSAPMPNWTTTVGNHTIRITAAKFISGDSIQNPSQTSQEVWSESVEFTVMQPPPQMYVATPYNKAPVIVK